jgi:hypothetical protein
MKFFRRAVALASLVATISCSSIADNSSNNQENLETLVQTIPSLATEEGSYTEENGDEKFFYVYKERNVEILGRTYDHFGVVYNTTIASPNPRNIGNQEMVFVLTDMGLFLPIGAFFYFDGDIPTSSTFDGRIDGQYERDGDLSVIDRLDLGIALEQARIYEYRDRIQPNTPESQEMYNALLDHYLSVTRQRL